MPLTDEQRRHLIRLLQRGEDLPIDYQYLLFPSERREYALAYANKEREVDILANTKGVPLQGVRTFGDNGSAWHNRLIFGDNLQVMRRLLEEKEAGRLCSADGTPGVRLVYIDPPFATKQEFRGSQAQKAYQDRVAGAQFVEFLRKRLVLLQALLAHDGILCVHLDFRKKHYIKVILDEIFGEHSFRNEIAVSRVKKSIRERERVRKLNEEFDTIFVYANSASVTLLPPMRSVTRAARWHAFDAAGLRTGMDYELFGHTPPDGRHWMYSKERAEQMIAAGTLRPNPRTGRPQYLIAASDRDLCNNLWTDISAYAFSTGYPTEKSETLLSRVLEMASRPGDLVLDAFVGSGTTCAVAEKLGRRWIGIDSGKFAMYTIQKRMLRLKEKIGNRGKPRRPSAFTLYNAGCYDVDADGFDFMHAPTITWSAGIGRRSGQRLEEAYLHIQSVTSRVGVRGADTPGGLETLSMLMLDYDYHDSVFNFDAVFYADDLRATAWRAWFPKERLGAKIMAVFIDIYGNESHAVIPVESFTARADS